MSDSFATAAVVIFIAPLLPVLHDQIRGCNAVLSDHVTNPQACHD